MTEQSHHGDIIPGQYIIWLKPGHDVASVTESLRIKPDCTYAKSNGFAAQLSDQQLELLRKDDRISDIWPNRIIKPCDPEECFLPRRYTPSDKPDIDIAIIGRGLDIQTLSDLSVHVVQQRDFRSSPD